MSNYNKAPDYDYYQGNVVTILIFESIFLIDLILSFFVDYKEESAPDKPVRDLGKIAINYLKTDFFLDFITLLPLNFYHLYRRRHVLFFMVKMLRLYKGFALFDVPKIMEVVKKAY